MKELASSFAQVIAIIMLTLVLAVSTAAISQWASADVSSSTTNAAPTILVSETR